MRIPIIQVNQVLEYEWNKELISEIRKNYEDFVEKVLELIKAHDITDPIEIQTIYNYLVYKGYLSVGKSFTFANSKLTEIKKIYGATVLSGRACCRHIAPMLTAILKKNDIPTWNLGVVINGSKVTFSIIEEKKYTYEELIDRVNRTLFEPIERENCVQILKLLEEKKQNVEISFTSIPYRDPIGKMVGNHQISCAYDNGRLDFLDPTQARVYRPKDEEAKVLWDDQLGEIKIRSIPFITGTSKEELNKILELSRTATFATDEERQELIEKTLKLCEASKEEFEEFHKENSELLEDTKQKVLKLERKMLI